MKRYNPKELEPKWQKAWEKTKAYKAVDFDKKRPKFVMLTEFPYLSGAGIHLGHVREYTYGDIIARRKRMDGLNVLYPMGYDEFGLPTENYAIKNKISPQKATEQNITNFQKQLESLGLSVDWDRKINTSKPSYYKWTQWLFLQFFNHGLAYQEEIAINWCPHCKTGLANEEVVGGRHERCETLVEKKLLKQWLLKITQYADRLIKGLEKVDYPSRIAEQQINWIGRSRGAEIDFKIEGSKHKVSVFTTRTDTIFSAAFLVLAPEHTLADKIITSEQRPHVYSYIKAAQSKTDIERQEEDREKTGVFTGAYAINPANEEKIPVWISDFVLASYGTGAVFGDIHDERDFIFLKKFGISARVTVVPENEAEANKIKAKEYAYTGEGLLISSGKFTGIRSEVARDKIIDWLAKKGVARETINYRLRDWIFSRQHYWGEPIPIIHCPKDGAVPVPEEQLPVELPLVEHYEPTDTGESPLAAVSEWVNVTCPTCGGHAKRETDTMPNWAGSSWYYLRYYDAHNDKAFADKKKLEYWGEADLYLGGMEHTTLHLLYSRFWHQFLYDQELVPTAEPYASRRGQGIILAADGVKMSKSKGNVVDPADIIKSGYGADALRLAIVFLAPYDQTTPWSPEAVAGTHRFLQRVWTLVNEYMDSKKKGNRENADELTRLQHQAIAKVSSDLQELGFNTAVAALMEYVNALYKIKASDNFGAKEEWQEAISTLLLLLAPFAPHLSEELWRELGRKESIHTSPWPVHDPKHLKTDTINIVVQVNGKVRANVQVPAGADELAIIKAAQTDKKVQGYLGKKPPKKTIYVPGKLVNFVV